MMMLRGKHRKEPLWFGRGASECLAIWPNKNGPYHEIYIGNDKGEYNQSGPHMQIMDHDLDELIIFLLRVRGGTCSENG